MSDFARGMADGQLAGRAMRAEAGAASASAAADDAQRRTRRATNEAENAEAAAAKWRSLAISLRSRINDYAGTATAGVVVMSALVEAMNEMSPADRDRMREKLVNISRARILALDSQARGTDQYVDIESCMRNLEQNKVLGIV